MLEIDTRYINGKIYKLVSNVTGDVYYGSTILSLEDRELRHKSDYKRYLQGKKNYVTSFKIIETGNFKIKLVEAYACLCRSQLEAIERIEKGKVQFSSQQESLVKIARKLKKEDGLINWQDEARAIHNKVRALLPWPCAYTHFKGKFIKILKTGIVEGDSEIGSENSPGEILEMVKQRGIIVATLKGNLLIEILQLEGKRAMPAYDFVLGHKMLIGDKLG